MMPQGMPPQSMPPQAYGAPGLPPINALTGEEDTGAGFGTSPYPSSPMSPAPMMAPAPSMPPAPMAGGGRQNFNYTYSGPEQLAPVKIYDDGQSTYFAFQPGSAPNAQIFMIGPDGHQVPVPSMISPSGEMVVSGLAPRFMIQRDGASITVFNENALSQRTM